MCRGTTMRRFLALAAAIWPLALNDAAAHLSSAESFDVPKLPAGTTVTIDGDLSDWKDQAQDFNGIWTIQRVAQQPWYTTCNMWNDTGLEPAGTALTSEDLAVQYYMAWDDDFLYFGAEVLDNVYDDGLSGQGTVSEGVALYLDMFHDGDGNTWVLVTCPPKTVQPVYVSV